jgi:cytochrome c-type biogenesis protein CcmF
MADFGNTALYVTLVLSTWAGALALVGARRRSARLVEAARLSLLSAALVSGASIVALTYAFASSDFSIAYVQHYSDRTMPIFYKITALWGGQEGSLLLWAWLLLVFSGLAVNANRERLRDILPHAIVVLSTVEIFFSLLILLTANPFDTFLLGVPTSGRGLNPLLQNAYMVTHPPSLYVGYVGMAIPFAFASASLLGGRSDDAWIAAVRPFALASWYFLSMGLVLGMLWAYEELGWGGYWAWDPVENAGLIPWLTATAYIHSVMVQERRGMLKVWNIVLVILTFELTIFGTFLTRSGFIDSVHSFARSEIGWYFLGFMGIVLLFAAGLIAWRRPLLASRGELESILSREFTFLINNWVLLSAAFLVLVLTIFPTISQLFGNKITISAPAFNRWMVPIGLALLILKGVGPMLAWRKTTLRGLVHQFLSPAVLLAAIVALLAVLGVRGAIPMTVFGLAGFVLATVIQEAARGVSVRRRRSGMNPLLGLATLVSRNRRRYGGYLVHAGVVLMYIGFAGEAYKKEAEVVLAKGQSAAVGAYRLTLEGIEVTHDAQKETATATLSLLEDGRPSGRLRPARSIYAKHEGQPQSEVDIRRSAKEDLFVVLGDMDPRRGTGTFKVIVNALVNWIWIGFVLLSLGTLVAIVPYRSASRARPARSGGGSVAGAKAILLVGLALAVGIGAALSASRAARADGPTGSSGRPRAGSKHVPAKTVPLDHSNANPVRVSSELEHRIFSRLACMCRTCPKQPLSVCQCGFAAKEREAIRQKLALGLSEEAIIAWYTTGRGRELGEEPFGAAALTIPPSTGFNQLSWLLPYLASGLAALVLLFMGRRWVRTGRRTGATEAGPGVAVPGAGADPALPGEGASPAAPPSTKSKEQAAYEDLLERELRELD